MTKDKWFEIMASYGYDQEWIEGAWSKKPDFMKIEDITEEEVVLAAVMMKPRYDQIKQIEALIESRINILEDKKS